MPKCEDLCEAIQSHNNPSPCPYHRCLRSWSWSVLWRPRKSPRTNTHTHKRWSIHHWGLECKSRKSRYTWCNRQVWGTKWSRAKVNWILPRKHASQNKHLLPTTQETTIHMDITRWSILKSDWLYSLEPKMQKLYTVSKNKAWTWLWLRSLASHSEIQLKL